MKYEYIQYVSVHSGIAFPVNDKCNSAFKMRNRRRIIKLPSFWNREWTSCRKNSWFIT